MRSERISWSESEKVKRESVRTKIEAYMLVVFTI